MITLPYIDKIAFSLKRPHYDDITNVLTYHYTPIVLTFFSIILTGKLLVGNAIECWTDAQFQNSWNRYTEDYCFVKGGYFLPFNQPFPSAEMRKATEMSYYPWTGIFLTCQACMFLLCSVFWRFCSDNISLPLKTVLSRAAALKGKIENEDSKIELLADYIRGVLKNEKRFVFGPLTTCFLTAKMLYAVHTFIQLLVLQKFLGMDRISWGSKVLHNLLAGKTWEITGDFARVAMCDLQVRTQANTNNLTVQCVLMMNAFHEKVFLFIYVWFSALFILNCVSLLHSVCFLAHPKLRKFIVRSLASSASSKTFSCDAVLLLALISANCTKDIAKKIAQALYTQTTTTDEWRDPLGEPSASGSDENKS